MLFRALGFAIFSLTSIERAVSSEYLIGDRRQPLPC